MNTSAHINDEEARWAALRMTHRQLRDHLGGHRFQARHEVATSLAGNPEQAYTDEYFLECAAQGDCHGRLDNSLEYGVEVIRRGEETFFRHRYQEYLRFAEEQEEAERRVEHLWGIGAAVLGLLRPLVHLEPSGEIHVEGRRASRYRLRPRPHPRFSKRSRGARGWRSRMTLTSVEGEVVLDLTTGAPLRLLVRYSVKAPKGKEQFSLAGNLRAEVKEVGSQRVIAVPEHFVEAAPRDREVLEVRALLGDQRTNPGWFRGGGPHAARARPGRPARVGPAPSPVRAMPAPSPPRASPARPMEPAPKAAPQNSTAPSPPRANPARPMEPAPRAAPQNSTAPSPPRASPARPMEPAPRVAP